MKDVKIHVSLSLVFTTPLPEVNSVANYFDEISRSMLALAAEVAPLEKRQP